MSNYPQYSTLFTTIYDQPKPVGSLGRGTHYSILRSVEWLDVIRQPLNTPQIHDFAIIWDGDHDERVIEPIEKMYMAGLLSPVQFIGERKAMLTTILASRFHYGISPEALKTYKNEVKKISQGLSDPWWPEFGFFDRAPNSAHINLAGISMTPDDILISYFKTLDHQWSLGTKEYFPSDLNRRCNDIPPTPPIPIT